jgi:hypothetical protein
MRSLQLELLLLALLILCSSPCLTAQGTDEDAPLARETPFALTINKVVGLPEQEVNIPILFARKSGAPNLAELRFRVSYPGSVITFNRAEDAYLSRRVNLRVEGKEASADGDRRSLEVTFTLPDAAKEFPSGQIGSIYFNVAAGAPDQVIPLKPNAWIDGNQILPDSPDAQIVPGEVRVSQTPVYLSCFFFSH